MQRTTFTRRRCSSYRLGAPTMTILAARNRHEDYYH